MQCIGFPTKLDENMAIDGYWLTISADLLSPLFVIHTTQKYQLCLADMRAYLGYVYLLCLHACLHMSIMKYLNKCAGFLF